LICLSNRNLLAGAYIGKIYSDDLSFVPPLLGGIQSKVIFFLTIIILIL
jgi:hypothetical protein